MSQLRLDFSGFSIFVGVSPSYLLDAARAPAWLENLLVSVLFSRCMVPDLLWVSWIRHEKDRDCTPVNADQASKQAGR